MEHDGDGGEQPGFFASRANIVLVGFLVLAAFYLITEHTAHLFGVAALAAPPCCPLIHFFMHGGHGGHGGDENAGAPSERQSSSHQH